MHSSRFGDCHVTVSPRDTPDSSSAPATDATMGSSGPPADRSLSSESSDIESGRSCVVRLGDQLLADLPQPARLIVVLRPLAHVSGLRAHVVAARLAFDIRR